MINKIGKPAYRTPNRFIANKSKGKRATWRPWDQATKLEHQRTRERRKRSSQ